MKAKITGVGSYIPHRVVKNEDFLNHTFLNNDGSTFSGENETIIEKFVAITGIKERRYIDDNQVTSDIAAIAAQRAIDDSGIDAETLDYIILAHNYGDIKALGGTSDAVPSLASRVKNKLAIKNPGCVAYDVLFGCPGWVLGVSQAYAFIQAGMAKKVLVIGAESLSRAIDAHDRDGMIYSDGAGATVIEAVEGGEAGILGLAAATYTAEEAFLIYNSRSYNPAVPDNGSFIKMYGRRIYNFALTQVPAGMQAAMDNAGVDIKDLKKIFIHQANEKMDEAIVERFYKLHDMEMPKDVMPMNIHLLGNSSVATVPTVFDMVVKGELEGYSLAPGDLIMFASVGAGMNINAIVYSY